MDNQVTLSLLEMSLLIFTAEAARSFMGKYGLPLIVGEILTGIVLSPFALGGAINMISGIDIFSLNQYVLFLSEFSMILLIFASGLEHGTSSIRSAGVMGFLGASVGAVLPFAVAFIVYKETLGFTPSLIVATALGATSLAAVVSTLMEMRLHGRAINYLIAASSTDDIVDLILFSVVLASISSTELTAIQLIRTITFYLLAWVTIFLVSVILIPRIANRIGTQYVEEFPFVVLFGLTAIMTAIGFSPIISAFMAGVALAESTKREEMRRISETLLSVFGSIFFVVVGLQVDVLRISLNVLELGLELTIIAMIFKMIGVFPFAYFSLRNFRSSLAVSVGMTPRGETGLVVASIGESFGAVSQGEFTALVLMAILTTLLGAMAFKRLAIWLEPQ
jgi:Kef-type K+ transport system membrane component KefB